ncbi:hypothetical protein SanaruYs_05970 [Chryseotalea sanaruensis]|uniref:Carrier domain-containing protein n=1 Tax=Chryseotalea sanaruensis TaxID=2482724 RepID=A0A401U698_9BACT|nr:phosphopantetheine-binding protein [Chryseotalea sanaruensis]GCC50382.1 hypothetical protein SanaruYs_05970 [Chryseotalea sanaruensis]
MSKEEIKKRVFKALKNIAPDTEPEKLSENSNIRKSLMIDSFDFLQFIVALDNEFAIQTPEEDYGKIGTLEELTSYILEQKSKNAIS